jgi:hypothetical protein
MGQHRAQFPRPPRLAEQHQHIARRHHPQIAMRRLPRMQEQRRAARGAHRGGDLARDQARFAKAADHRPPRRARHHRHRARKGAGQCALLQSRRQPRQPGQFGPHHRLSPRQQGFAHPALLPQRLHHGSTLSLSGQT